MPGRVGGIGQEEQSTKGVGREVGMYKVAGCPNTKGGVSRGRRGVRSR